MRGALLREIVHRKYYFPLLFKLKSNLNGRYPAPSLIQVPLGASTGIAASNYLSDFPNRFQATPLDYDKTHSPCHYKKLDF